MPTPEQNIYENGPTPTNDELRHGLNLLVETYGVALDNYRKGLEITMPDRPGEIILIDRLEEGECAGIKALRQISSPINKEGRHFETTSNIHLCKGVQNSADDSKLAGEIILKSWELFNNTATQAISSERT